MIDIQQQLKMQQDKRQNGYVGLNQQQSYPVIAPLRQDNSDNPYANYYPVPVSATNVQAQPNTAIRQNAQQVGQPYGNNRVGYNNQYQNISANTMHSNHSNQNSPNFNPNINANINYNYNANNNPNMSYNPNSSPYNNIAGTGNGVVVPVGGGHNGVLNMNINNNQELVATTTFGSKQLGDKIRSMCLTVLICDVVVLLFQVFVVFVPLVYFLIYNVAQIITFAIIYKFSIHQGRATVKSFNKYRTLIVGQLILAVVVVLVLAVIVASTNDRWAGVVMLYIVIVAVLYQLPKMILLCVYRQQQTYTQVLQPVYNQYPYAHVYQPPVYNKSNRVPVNYNSNDNMIVFSNNANNGDYQRI